MAKAKAQDVTVPDLEAPVEVALTAPAAVEATLVAEVVSASSGGYVVKHGQVFVGGGEYRQVGEAVSLTDDDATRLMAEGVVMRASLG